MSQAATATDLDLDIIQKKRLGQWRKNGAVSINEAFIIWYQTISNNIMIKYGKMLVINYNVVYIYHNHLFFFNIVYNYSYIIQWLYMVHEALAGDSTIKTRSEDLWMNISGYSWVCVYILVGGLVAILYFPIYWVSNHPNWLIFFRGVQTTNQYIYIYGHSFAEM